MRLDDQGARRRRRRAVRAGEVERGARPSARPRRPPARRSAPPAGRRGGAPPRAWSTVAREQQLRRTRRAARPGCPASPRPGPRRRAAPTPPAPGAAGRGHDAVAAGRPGRRSPRAPRSSRPWRHLRQLARIQGRFGRRVLGVGRGGGAVRAPALAGQPQQRPAHQHRHPRRQHGPEVLPPPDQVRRPGLQRAGVELHRLQQRPVAAAGRGRGPLRLLQRLPGLAHPGGLQHPARVRRGQPLQVTQHERRPAGRRQLRQGLVQGEFIGAAGPREQPQPPHLGERRRQRGQPQAGAAARGERRAQHPQAYEGVAGAVGRVGAAARGGQREIAGGGALPRQGPLHDRMGGQDAAAAARAGRKDEIGQPYEPGIVLHQRRFGLFDVDGVTEIAVAEAVGRTVRTRGCRLLLLHVR